MCSLRRPWRQQIWALIWLAGSGLLGTSAAALMPEPANPGASSVAAPPTADSAWPDARFFIERIVVEGNWRSSESLLISESLLDAGNMYSESQLSDAIHRIQRLPFILQADFALRKGAKRDRYVLAIRVQEIRRFFFGDDLVVTRFTNSVAFDSLFAEHTVVSGAPLAGIRFFLGQYNEVFGSLAGERGAQLGYTRYNLFGRRIFFNLSLEAGDCCTVRVFPLGIDPTFSSWQNEGRALKATVTMGIPLGGNQSLQWQASSESSARGERRNLLGLDRSRGTLDYRDLEQHRADLSWIWDSTDDPVLPSRGLRFRAGLDYTEVEARLSLGRETYLFGSLGPAVVPEDPSLGDELPTLSSRQLRLAGNISQHWQLGRRQTVSLSARVAIGQATVENLPVLGDGPEASGTIPLQLIEQQNLDLFETYLTARYSLSLWSARKTRSQGDLRWETLIAFGWDRTLPDLGLPDNPLERKSITTSVVFRNTWGLFRFSFQIADYGTDS